MYILTGEVTPAKWDCLLFEKEPTLNGQKCSPWVQMFSLESKLFPFKADHFLKGVGGGELGKAKVSCIKRYR